MESQGYVLKDFPHSSHRWLLQKVGRHPTYLLEVGTWNGFLGQKLRELGHRVVGLEKDTLQAAAARPFYQELLVADLEALPPLPGAPFPLILCGDVLEHTREPEKVLAHLLTALEPGGRILVTVPNVAFVSLRLALLFGHFTYRQRGILDRTHLRFFTKASLLRLLHQQGLEVLQLRGLPPPLPLLWPGFAQGPGRPLYQLAAGAARLWPSLWAYQLAAEAKKPL